MPQSPRTGRCHCGRIRFELAQDEFVTLNCHCRNCRRANGGPFSTLAPVHTSNFRIVSGEDSLRRFQTPTGFRFFCGECGGRLFTRPNALPGMTNLLVSTLDVEPTQRPILHANVESMAPWHRIDDDLPQYQALPGADTAEH